MTMTKPVRSLRPTLDTPFHIDYDWWNKGDRDLRVYLRSHLCREHRLQYSETDAEIIDWVDPHTAEVTRMDGLLLVMRTHCAQQSDFIADYTGVVDGAFRIFLINGNQPLTSREIAEQLNRDADIVLKTLGGKQIYQGIRPVSA